MVMETWQGSGKWPCHRQVQCSRGPQHWGYSRVCPVELEKYKHIGERRIQNWCLVLDNKTKYIMILTQHRDFNSDVNLLA